MQTDVSSNQILSLNKFFISTFLMYRIRNMLSKRILKRPQDRFAFSLILSLGI